MPTLSKRELRRLEDPSRCCCCRKQGLCEFKGNLYCRAHFIGLLRSLGVTVPADVFPKAG
jgi:hypothetical protein